MRRFDKAPYFFNYKDRKGTRIGPDAVRIRSDKNIYVRS
jgi:hypothetical protein